MRPWGANNVESLCPMLHATMTELPCELHMLDRFLLSLCTAECYHLTDDDRMKSY